MNFLQDQLKENLKKVVNVNRDLQQKLHESGVDGSAAGASMSTVNQTHLGQIFN